LALARTGPLGARLVYLTSSRFIGEDAYAWRAWYVEEHRRLLPFPSLCEMKRQKLGSRSGKGKDANKGKRWEKKKESGEMWGRAKTWTPIFTRQRGERQGGVWIVRKKGLCQKRATAKRRLSPIEKVRRRDRGEKEKFHRTTTEAQNKGGLPGGRKKGVAEYYGE